MPLSLEQAAEKMLSLMEQVRQLGTEKDTPPPQAANISTSQLAAINFIAATPGCGVQSLATGLKLSKPSISINVRQIEEAGFITRQPDPQDGRAVQLYLTPKGETLQQRTFEFRCQKFQRLLKGLTVKERTTLLDLLEHALSATKNENKEI